MKTNIEVKAKTKVMANAEFRRPKLSYQSRNQGEKSEAKLPNIEL